MAGLFKKDTEGKNLLSRSFTETVNMAGHYKECFGDEFIDLAKGEHSSFLGLDGQKTGQRILGLAVAPIMLPIVTVYAPVLIPLYGIAEAVDKHKKAEEQKPPQNKYDQM